MINLKHLELNNFLSHVETSLPLEDYKGLVLIEGSTSDGHYSSNGSGKSTLLEGIVYALTGETLRGVSVNDVVNRNYKKNTKVSLLFNSDENNYEVNRYRKDDEFGDSLVLKKGEENISKRLNKETQKSLDDILGISYKILVSTILLGEGLSSRFTQLSDPDKKSLIESTLNLNYDISAIRAKSNSLLSKLKLDKSNIEGRLTTLKEISDINVDEVNQAIERHLSVVAETSKDLEVLKASIEELQASRSPLENKSRLIADSIKDIDSILNNISKLQSESLKYQNELKESLNSEVPICNVCHQPLVSEDSKNSFTKSYEEKLNSIDTELKLNYDRLSKLPERSLLESKYSEIIKELKSVDSKLYDYNSRMNELNSTYWSNNSKVDQLKSMLSDYDTSVSQISLLEDELSSIESNISKYEYFYKLFSPTGIIVNILSDAIDYINTRLSTYSEILLEKDYKINFVKGKISLVDSKGSNYQSLSNGEKRRLDIAIQFSLHDYVTMYCGMKVDTIFVDEILDTLDDVGVENIIDVLRIKLSYCSLRSIFVITHNDALKSKFDQIITIKKDEKGDSHLV